MSAELQEQRRGKKAKVECAEFKAHNVAGLGRKCREVSCD